MKVLLRCTHQFDRMEFKITTAHIELIGLLKATGIAMTGGHAKVLVEDGLVEVNNEQEFRKRRKLVPGDEVLVEGELIKVV